MPIATLELDSRRMQILQALAPVWHGPLVSPRPNPNGSARYNPGWLEALQRLEQSAPPPALDRRLLIYSSNPGEPPRPNLPVLVEELLAAGANLLLYVQALQAAGLQVGKSLPVAAQPPARQ